MCVCVCVRQRQRQRRCLRGEKERDSVYVRGTADVREEVGFGVNEGAGLVFKKLANLVWVRPTHTHSLTHRHTPPNTHTDSHTPQGSRLL